MELSLEGASGPPVAGGPHLPPLGLRSLGVAEPDIVPWVWGVNGALSVLGSVLAIFAAIHLGFRVTLTLGAALYLLAWFLARRWQPMVLSPKS